jgi:hypothetical protein
MLIPTVIGFGAHGKKKKGSGQARPEASQGDPLPCFSHLDSSHTTLSVNRIKATAWLISTAIRVFLALPAMGYHLSISLYTLALALVRSSGLILTFFSVPKFSFL